MKDVNKKYIIMLVILMAVVFYAGARYSQAFSGAWESQPSRVIAVFVKGAVSSEGYIELPSKSRVNDLLLQNPPLAEADLSDINTARFLVDGEELYIPYQKGSAPTPNEGKININTADKTMLMKLRGIGDTKARAIISYREAHGDFKRIEDIKKVSGIGNDTYEALREEICVD